MTWTPADVMLERAEAEAERPRPRVVPRTEEVCWFPYCGREAHHRGQHTNSHKAGEKLAKIREIAHKLIGEAPGSERRYVLLNELLHEALG